MVRINRITLYSAIAVFALIGGLSAWQIVSQPSPAVRSSGQALIGGPFELTRHDGKRITDRDLKGSHSLVFFGYTFCPDVCPAGLQVMSAALDKLGTKADGIQPVFVTIDPERDTAKVLGEYIEHFHPRMIGLTGSAEDIAKAAKAYRVYYKKAAGEAGDEDYLMDHSSIFYLMGPDGEFVKHFGYTTDVDSLANGIAEALGS